MPRVIADVNRLDDYVAELTQLDQLRRSGLRLLVDDLARFVDSGSEFGPRHTSACESIEALIADATIDVYSVMATGEAFRAAEVAIEAGLLSGWHPDDRWIEQRRRDWLGQRHPSALLAAAPTIESATALARIAEIDEAFARARDTGFLSVGAAQALAAERHELASDLVVHVSALTDSINAWAGSENDPVLDTLLARRDLAVAALMDGDLEAATHMTSLVNAGLAPPVAYSSTMHFVEHERRIGEVVDSTGVSRSEAEIVIDEMDTAIADMLQQGHGVEEAVVAVGLAEHLDLDLEQAVGRALADHAGVVDTLGRMALARSMDVDMDGLLALEGLREHFSALDSARSSGADGRVSEADLLHVVTNPGSFEPAQVLAAQAILDEPILRHRLDTAAQNHDVIDTDTFGRSHPDDRVISLADIEAFVVRTGLNELLGPQRDELDTAAEQGDPDGRFSERDLQGWLDANPDAPPPIRDGIEYLLSEGLVDRSWLENNREALAMGAAVVAGGVVVVMTGGSATPAYVVLGAGFLGGGAAAGATTVAVNHRTGDHLGDGVLSNSLNGAMIGLSVAGLPGAWSNVVSSGPGITVRGIGASSTVTAEVAGVVGSGGADLVIPDDWEARIHTGAGTVEKVAGLVAVGAGSVPDPSTERRGPR